MRLGERLTLEATPTVPPATLDAARPFSRVPVDERVARQASQRRQEFLDEAGRAGLDQTSLGRALEVAATGSPGTRSLVAEVRPAQVDGRAAWLIVQAWGYEGGTMDYARAWLIDATSGQVVSTLSKRL